MHYWDNGRAVLAVAVGLVFIAVLATYLAAIPYISSCPFPLFPSLVQLGVSDSANLQPLLAVSTACRAVGARWGSRRLRGSLCCGSLEVKNLRLRRQVAKVCCLSPVGRRHSHSASQRGADVTPGVLVCASRHCFPTRMPPLLRR